MILEVIRQAIRHDPFIPFSIKLKNGKTFHVNKLGFLAVGWNFILKTTFNSNQAEIIPETEIASVSSRHKHSNSRKKK